MNSEIESILNTVADICYVLPEDIVGETRRVPVVDARHIFRKIIFDEYKGKTSELERLTGIDHSNFNHSVKVFNNLVSTDITFKNKYERCNEAVSNWKTLVKGKPDIEESDYDPFIILIRMIEANHSIESIKLNLPICKNRINYLAGFKYFL